MRELITSFDRQFHDLYCRCHELIQKTGDELLYLRPNETGSSMRPFSVAGSVVRSAAVVEQMIGGITTRLWDDPFEWTLPEQLSTRKDVLNYIEEVEQGRLRGFSFFRGDDDLNKTLPAPVEFRTLGAVLEDTLAEAERSFGRAAEIYRALASRDSAT